MGTIHRCSLFGRVCRALCAFLLSTGLTAFAQQTEGVNPQLLKTLVSVEVLSGFDTNENRLIGQPIGSAFLVLTPGHHCLLVTAKHVAFESTGILKGNLAYRVNNVTTNSDLIPETHMQQYAGPWFMSTNHDVACRFIVVGEPDVSSFTFDQFLPQRAIRPGAPVLVTGFPLGLRSERYAVPIVRRGIVAFADETSLMLDAFTFPGNSGGPVIYSSVLGNVVPIARGDLLRGDALIGLVSSSLPYVDIAISPQTKRPRITFEENSGLTHIVPAQEILALLQREDVRAFEQNTNEWGHWLGK